jgi:voltage-gated potassium channel
MAANREFLRGLYQLLEPGDHGRKLTRFVDRFIVCLIILNVAAVIAESFQTVADNYGRTLSIFEAVSVGIFTAEYLARVLTSRFKFPHLTPGRAFLRYLVTPMALIDLAAVLPFYLPMIVAVDLRFLRILRLTRLLRVLKINRYTKALGMIGSVLKKKSSELAVTVFVMLLLLLLSASIMYYLETDEQPDAFPNIIATFWWAVATLTTVGYGDVYPVTGCGRLLAGIIAILGVGLVALPTGIISSGFLEVLQDKEDDNKRAARLRRAAIRRKSLRRMRQPTRGKTRRRD